MAAPVQLLKKSYGNALFCVSLSSFPSKALLRLGFTGGLFGNRCAALDELEVRAGLAVVLNDAFGL